MAQTMAVQFAVLSSGSRGNSTLICGKGAGLLIDVGIGPKILGERLESVGSSWSRIASVVLTHTHADHVDSATFNELARRGVTVHCHEGHRQALAAGPRIQEARGVRGDPLLRRSPVPGFERAAARADRALARRRPDLRFPDRGLFGAPRAAGRDRLSGRLRLLVGRHGREPGRGRPDRPRIQPRRRDAEIVPQARVSDRAKPERRRTSLERARRPSCCRPFSTRSQQGAPRHVVLLHLSEQCNQPELALQAARDALQAAGREAQVHVARQTLASPSILLSAGRGRGARLRSHRRSTADAASQKTAGTEKRHGPLQPVSCAGTRTRTTSPRRSSDRGALFRQRRPPAIRSTRSRPALQQLAQPA